MVEHLGYFLGDEGNRPTEDIHEVGEEIGMLGIVELLDVESVILNNSIITINLITAPLLLYTSQ